MNKTSGKLLYLENGLSQQLIVLFLVGNTLFTIVHTNTMGVNARIGTFILLNIALSLLAFLMAVQQKLYSSSWGYLGVVMALFQLSRLLWLPNDFSQAGIRPFLQILLIITGGLLLLASVVCIRRTQERQAYIERHNIDTVTLEK